MVASNKCIELIKSFEGLELTAYKCPAGVYTIGYGHTANVYPGMQITAEQAEKYLIDDIKIYENNVNKYNDIYHWTQPEFDALVSFAFNIGGIKQLTQNGTRNKQTIAEYMLKYVFADGVKLDGLVRRRQAEHDLFVSDYIAETDHNIITENNTIKDLIDLIIAGKYGNDEDRKENLYNDIQALVNARYK